MDAKGSLVVFNGLCKRLLILMFCIQVGSCYADEQQFNEISQHSWKNHLSQNKPILYKCVSTIRLSLLCGFLLSYANWRPHYNNIKIGCAFSGMFFPLVAFRQFTIDNPTDDDIKKMDWLKIVFSFPEFSIFEDESKQV